EVGRAGIVVVAVDGVACACGACGAVKIPYRQNVGEHGGEQEGVGGVDGGVLRLAEIRHDGRLPGIVGIEVVCAVGGRSVVVAGMAEAERMADLVDEGLQRIGGSLAGQPVGCDVDGGGQEGGAAAA